MRTYKPQPRTVRFDYLLHRRGLTFEAWAKSSGVSSYVEVVKWCDRIGVVPPTEAEWLSYMPAPVNVPTEGIVVVEPAPEAVESPAVAPVRGKRVKPEKENAQ